MLEIHLDGVDLKDDRLRGRFEMRHYHGDLPPGTAPSFASVDATMDEVDRAIWSLSRLRELMSKAREVGVNQVFQRDTGSTTSD